MAVRKSLLIGVLVIGLSSIAACGTAVDTNNEPSTLPENTADTPAPTASTDTTSAEETKSDAGEATIEERASDPLPPGSIALFATISGGTKSQLLKQDGHPLLLNLEIAPVKKNSNNITGSSWHGQIK